jgi:hypothetical protein
MSDEPRDQQTEQTPKGLAVRAPKRDEFCGNLRKVAEPEKRPDPPGDHAASASDE